MGDNQKSQNSVQTSEPWEEQVPYLKEIMGSAQSLYKNNTPQYFPGSTVVGFSPAQQQAQQLGQQRAVNGSPLNQAAGGYLQDSLAGNNLNPFGNSSYGWNAPLNETMNGSMLNAGNADAMDYFSKTARGDFLNDGDMNGSLFDSIRSQVQPAVNSQFMSSGRYHSGANQGRMTEALTNAYAPIMFNSREAALNRQAGAAGALQDSFGRERANQLNAAGLGLSNYQNERGLQQGMAQFAPILANEDWTDIGKLNEIGGQQQQLGQAELQDAINRYNYNQDLPYNKLAQYLGLIGGNYGGQVASATPYTQPGLFSQIGGLGLGLLGAFL